MAEAKLRYTYREYLQWVGFEQMFGPITLHERLDVLFARSDALFAEANRNRKKRRTEFKPSDFIVPWDGKRKRRRKAPDEIWAFMQQFAARQQIAQQMFGDKEPGA